MFPIYCTIISNKLQGSAVFSAKRGQSAGLAARYEPQANKKFFGAAVFQKCCRGVGEQPTFAKQIKLYSEMKQKSKREPEESQLPSKSEDCNVRYGFRGNCDSQGKLGMCPSLAEPDSGGFPRTSRRQLKSFLLQQFFKNAGEVWASSPHLRSKSNCTIKYNKHLRENRKNRNCL